MTWFDALRSRFCDCSTETVSFSNVCGVTRLELVTKNVWIKLQALSIRNWQINALAVRKKSCCNLVKGSSWCRLRGCGVVVLKFCRSTDCQLKCHLSLQMNVTESSFAWQGWWVSIDLDPLPLRRSALDRIRQNHIATKKSAPYGRLTSAFSCVTLFFSCVVYLITSTYQMEAYWTLQNWAHKFTRFCSIKNACLRNPVTPNGSSQDNTIGIIIIIIKST